MSVGSGAPTLPGQPRDGDGPVFAEPWQAQAFALTLKLHEAGHFTWREWAVALGAEIDAARARGDPDLGDTYYRHWLTALERLAAEKGLAQSGELAACRTEAHCAARPVDMMEKPLRALPVSSRAQ